MKQLLKLDLAARDLPVFATFFLWSFGSAGQQLARPLFAASFGVPVLLISLIATSNSSARIVTAPITGFLTDRFGRKPMMLAGVLLRGITTFLEFFADSYLQFLILEWIGGVGVSTWTTGSSILMADLTTVENRGRVLAARSLSSRMGGIAGPFVAAAIGAAFGLRAMFLFNTVTKAIMLIILVYLIRETQPASARVMSQERTGASWRDRMSVFLTRPFMLLMAVTLTHSMMNQGIFMAILPVYLQEQVGFSTQTIGNLLTLAATATLIVTFPNGVLVDLYGRKRTLVPGLFAYALSALVLTQITDFPMAVAMVVLFGMADGVAMGSSQAYVIDIAPEGQRGAFIGSWSFFSGIGGVIAPLFVGVVAGAAGFATAFMLVAALLAISGLAMARYGPDFGGRRAVPAAGPATTF